MVNGLVNPVLNIQPGQVQRWRIINAGNARFYKFSTGCHTLYVISPEGIFEFYEAHQEQEVVSETGANRWGIFA